MTTNLCLKGCVFVFCKAPAGQGGGMAGQYWSTAMVDGAGVECNVPPWAQAGFWSTLAGHSG